MLTNFEIKDQNCAFLWQLKQFGGILKC